MWFWHCWRPHWLRSRSHSLVSCSSTLWGEADSLRTVSPRSPGLVWPICSSCSSSLWKAFQRCLGETKSSAIRVQWWREGLLAASGTDACFSFIISFKTPRCFLLSQSSFCSSVQHGSCQPATQQVSRCATLARFKSVSKALDFSVMPRFCSFFLSGSKKESHLLKGLVWTHQYAGTLWLWMIMNQIRHNLMGRFRGVCFDPGPVYKELGQRAGQQSTSRSAGSEELL